MSITVPTDNSVKAMFFLSVLLASACVGLGVQKDEARQKHTEALYDDVKKSYVDLHALGYTLFDPPSPLMQASGKLSNGASCREGNFHWEHRYACALAWSALPKIDLPEPYTHANLHEYVRLHRLWKAEQAVYDGKMKGTKERFEKRIVWIQVVAWGAGALAMLFGALWFRQDRAGKRAMAEARPATDPSKVNAPGASEGRVGGDESPAAATPQNIAAQEG